MASFGPQVKNMMEAAAGGMERKPLQRGRGLVAPPPPSYQEHALPLPPPNPVSAP